MDTSNSFTNNMETVEEEIKRMRESLVELDFKSEKAVVVESLTAEVHQMTEDKARQEEKTAAELERLAGKIAELNEAATARLADVDIYSQGVNTKIEELENTVEDRLAALADKTKGELDSGWWRWRAGWRRRPRRTSWSCRSSRTSRTPSRRSSRTSRTTPVFWRRCWC